MSTLQALFVASTLELTFAFDPFDPAKGGTSPDQGRVELARSMRSERFNSMTSGHFTAVFDVPADLMRRYIAEAEAVYQSVEWFCKSWGFARKRGHEPLFLLVFDQPRDFHAFSTEYGIDSAGRMGYYLPNGRTAMFVNAWNTQEFMEIQRHISRAERQLASLGQEAEHSDGAANAEILVQRRKELETLRTERDLLVETFNRFVLRHEVAHQVLYHFGVHCRSAYNPPWLVEGLAMQFEVDQPVGIETFAPNPWRLADFIQITGSLTNRPASDGFDGASAPEQTGLIPLPDLIMNRDYLEVGDDGLKPRAPDRAADAQILYAQSWALVAHLQQTSPREFGQFLHRVIDRPPGELSDAMFALTTFESAFGPLDAAFEDRWISSIRRLQPDVSGR